MVKKDFKIILEQISDIAVSATDASDLSIRVFPVYMRGGFNKAKAYIDLERKFRARPQ